MNHKLLLVDDEQGLLEMLNFLLKKEGFEHLYFAKDGKEALAYVDEISFDLIVLDIMLPDIDGFELCRRLREITQVPILFLSAKTMDLDKIMGLTIGGDDYITKPFNPLEVVARIKAHLRRQELAKAQQSSTELNIYDYGVFQLYRQEGKLVVNGEHVPCPAKEFELLAFLCEHPNQVFSIQGLYEKIWGLESFGDDNTVMVHIRRLRKKIEHDPTQPEFLINIRGFGYKLNGSRKELSE
ncbi:response regulator transcription factor [Bacillus horti]|uniref:DNA-binding response OmpR family regulator n=1 Tax=Caldalkalibacillus horti TaxID=77523 RepID=A0ABT9W4Z5_9BACI|nr:response regulator transcription factor [Bacillus horti]MDQ0168312.1 DNA-binding response OmpR family regulator [Bacillus horti]